MTWFWLVKKSPEPPAEKLIVLKMRVEAVEAGLTFKMRGDSVNVRRVGNESAFTFPSDVKERRRGELLSLPQSTAVATTTEELSGNAWVAICLWLGKANTLAPRSVPIAKTSWSPCGAVPPISFPSWLPTTRPDTFLLVAFTLSRSGLNNMWWAGKGKSLVLPFCQGKAGVKEAKLKDWGFES